MGIYFRDLVQSGYYKGYHQAAPMGKKCFFVVDSILSNSPTNPSLIEVVARFILRKTGTQQSWVSVVFQGKPDDESLFKQPVSAATITSEGMPLPAATLNAPASSPNPVTAPPASRPQNPQSPGTPDFGTLRHYFESEEDRKEREKRESKAARNAGKSVVYGNAHSPTCLRCGKQNREITTIGMYWCPECEPE